MDSQTVQYYKIQCGFQEEVIPLDSQATLGNIPFWEQVPLWQVGNARFTPVTRIYNNKATPLDPPQLLVWSLQLATFMQLHQGPKWGRNVQQKKQVVDIGNHGWGPATDEEVVASSANVDDDEERHVEIIDLSDNDDQVPPPPKKPRVVYESSDNRNLGT
jgi:hypothetical protein